jgi:hypothetical protein
MFELRDGPYVYRVKATGDGFNVKCKQAVGAEWEPFVEATVSCAYDDEVRQGSYMPTLAMIEFYVAKRLGIKLRSPKMESVPGRIY